MRLRIVDSALVNKRGHHYEYVKSVFDEWTSRGWPADVYCHRNAEADIVGYFHGDGIFSRGFHKRFRPVPRAGAAVLALDFLYSNYVYYRDMKKAGLSAAGGRDIFFFHTIDPNELFGVYLWYRSIRPENKPILALIFRLGVGDNAETRRYTTFLYRSFFRALSAVAGGKALFFSDSAVLAGEYGALSGNRVSVLPIPHIRVPDGGTPAAKCGAFEIVYLGDARIEKGFHLLPRVVESLLSRRSDVRFTIQTNVSDSPPPAISEAKRKMEAMRGGVSTIDRILESDEYYRILRRADAVLLPYAPDMYRGRTSGIFAEAIAFGKPVIVAGGTWMAQQVEEYGHCGIAMTEYTERDLERAIELMIDHGEEFRERAGTASRRWAKFHNAKAYVDMLIESATGASGRGTRG